MKKVPCVVPQYLFNVNDDISKYNARKKIIKLFIQYPGKNYKTQAEIAEAMKQLGGSLTQSAVSKAMKVLLNQKFKYHDKVYVITKFEKAYTLQNVQEFESSLRAEMTSQNLFKKEFVYYERGIKQPQTFVFWINEKEGLPKKTLQ